MTYQYLTVRMSESAKTNDQMVYQTIFKMAQRYGFNYRYFDEINLGIAA
jgi:hypothetical protein